MISRGLSMPHSPRWHDGRLWLLESGTGQLVLVDPATGHRETVAELPGFARGLALRGQYAFIGLSKIRATSAMDGVPLAERRDELKCGVAVVDLAGGRVCAHAGIPDRRGGDLRRSTARRRALPGSDGLPKGHDPTHVRHPASGRTCKRAD